jgi:hypothetical protein
MKPDLQYLALQIYELCIRYSIIIELEWIPRDLNVQADFYQSNANASTPLLPGVQNRELKLSSWWLFESANLSMENGPHFWYLRICMGTGVLIVPLWRSALFWPLLWDFDGNKFNSFVVDKMEFQKPRADLHKGTIRTPVPLQIRKWFKTRQTKYIGGTNQLLSLDQSNANASTPLLPVLTKIAFLLNRLWSVMYWR